MAMSDFKLLKHQWVARRVLKGSAWVLKEEWSQWTDSSARVKDHHGSYDLLALLFGIQVNATNTATGQKQQFKRRRRVSPENSVYQISQTPREDASGGNTTWPSFSGSAPEDNYESDGTNWNSPRHISGSQMEVSWTVPGARSRNRSQDSLRSLMENLDQLPDAQHGSPASVYSQSPTGSSQNLPLSRNNSAFPPVRHASHSRLRTSQQASLYCQCCPKHPMIFETLEALKKHESEKPYRCSFCGQYFRNRNEAERHTRSLHERRHSWSCWALVDYKNAFVETMSQLGEADDCGYCGKSFPRSGYLEGMQGKYATDCDWEQRQQHLQADHKHKECNIGKKFYRADHFRQHLKHSHAGLSGKWINLLENACMVEEERF
ncbi:hypothetical protein B0I35DRAFT_264651 [Stachybotrys elegans]|uniref:C2H2-type domain-containing protein n=1 Tax=Stachybotrys elegans TaxID=80388 RepID=A0A8K0WPV8_9HYPO|nr:hypothetical protein B0I35DRAFT_264651 [Stachybotrys elegans]